MADEMKCPVVHGAEGPRSVAEGTVEGGLPGHGAVTTSDDLGRKNPNWWPNALDLKLLDQNSPLNDPMGKDFNYAEEFKTLDLDALKQDIIEVMTTSQDWWPDRKSTRLNSS